MMFRVHTLVIGLFFLSASLSATASSLQLTGGSLQAEGSVSHSAPCSSSGPSTFTETMSVNPNSNDHLISFELFSQCPGSPNPFASSSGELEFLHSLNNIEINAIANAANSGEVFGESNVTVNAQFTLPNATIAYVHYPEGPMLNANNELSVTSQDGTIDLLYSSNDIGFSTYYVDGLLTDFQASVSLPAGSYSLVAMASKTAGAGAPFAGRMDFSITVPEGNTTAFPAVLMMAMLFCQRSEG